MLTDPGGLSDFVVLSPDNKALKLTWNRHSHMEKQALLFLDFTVVMSGGLSYKRISSKKLKFGNAKSIFKDHTVDYIETIVLFGEHCVILYPILSPNFGLIQVLSSLFEPFYCARHLTRIALMNSISHFGCWEAKILN